MNRAAELRPSWVLPVGLRWLFLGALFLGLLASAAAGATTNNWIEILRDDDSGMELRLRSSAPVIRDGLVEVPGFVPSGDNGQARTWSRAVYLAVPGGRGASVQVLDEKRRALSSVVVQRQWDPARYSVDSADGLPAPPDFQQPWKVPGSWPRDNVRLAGAGEFRGQPIVMLEFQPLQFTAAGAAEFVDEIRVRIQYHDRPQLRAGTASVPLLRRGLLNHATASRWETTSEAVRAAAPLGRRATMQDLPLQRLRITINETGIYTLTHTLLESAGLLLDNIDARTFKLFMDEWNWIPLAADSLSSWSPTWAMQEVDILVDGEADASLDPGDRIVFYAVGPAAYQDMVQAGSDSLEYRTHPYDRNRYAWLIWGDGASTHRMQEVSVAASEPLVDPLVSSVWHREHFELDQQFGKVDDLWYWQEISESRPALASFNLNLGNEASSIGDVRLGVGADAFFFKHAFDVEINGQIYPTSVWEQPGDVPRNHYVNYAAAPLNDGANNIVVRKNTTEPSAFGRTLFLKFDVSWQRPLVVSQARLAWTHRSSAPLEVFELRNFGPSQLGVRDPEFFDVTDAAKPIRLTNPTASVVGSETVWRARYGRAGRAQYQATRLDKVPQVLLRTVTPLRTRTRAPHMLYVTHTSLRSEVERLAAHRSTQFLGDLMGDASLDYQITNVRDIYENFSGGRVDPLAIRNYTRYLYDLDVTPRLQYLMLFGEATHDPRLNQLASTPTLVPTVQPWYADDRVRREYAIDDWFGEMGEPALSDNYSRLFPFPDFAIGRVTPRTLSSARLIVDKIIAYETTSEHGPWRTTVMLTADDEHHRGRAVETFHINQAELLPPWVPDEWDVEKFYLTEYPLVLGQKPEARQAFIRRWSQGLGAVIYQGHGAPRQLADEVLFLGTDIPALVNGTRLPAFMAFSCTVAEFDDPELQSMAEEMLTSAVGGAIVVMGATTPTFAGPNSQLGIQVFKAIWEDGATARVPLGVALMLAKQRSPSSNGKDNERYAYIGDPAMPLLAPAALAQFTSGADTLQAGASARITGVIADTTGAVLPGFQGEAEVAVYGSADESGYLSIYPPNVFIRYDLRGAPLYRGEVSVVNGAFAFDFFVPLNAALGSKGRLSTYVAGNGNDALGGRSDLVLQVAAVVEIDSLGPEIALRFPNDLTHVKPGTELVAELNDAQGINIQGTTLRSSIFLDFDNANQPIDITTFFRYQSGSATFGTVTVALPDDLSPGSHTATMVASDNLQNTSTKTIGFEVVEEQVTQLVNVVAFPNPFRDRTHFIFEITDAAEVEVQVFTSSGRQVWQYRQDYQEAGQVLIEWHGVDHVGDEIANGTYLYRVRAYPKQAGASSLHHIGKVVVVRES